MRGDFKRGLALVIAIVLGALVMVWWSLQPAP
jgi:hypothetical protein